MRHGRQASELAVEAVLLLRPDDDEGEVAAFVPAARQGNHRDAFMQDRHWM